MSAGDIFLGVLAIIFPPIAVWIKSGICSCDSLINILLCMLGYLPGLIHAWYIISVYPEENLDYEPVPDAERATHHHYYVVNGSPQQQHGGYGTTQQGAPPNVPKSTRPPQQQQQQGASAGEGSNGAPRPPPTYAEAVKGDHKIQTQD